MTANPCLRFHLNAPQETPAGKIYETGELRNSAGTGWERPRNYPYRAAVLLVQGGGIYRDTRGEDVRVGPGDLLLVNPDIGHTYGPDAGQGWHEYYVSFAGPIFDSLEACGVLNPSRPVWRLGDPQPWRGRFIAMFPPPRSKNIPNACEQTGALVTFLLEAALVGAPRLSAPERPDWLARATDLLARPGALDLEAVARACGLGYENFRKRFTQLAGQSPALYRRRALIAHAQRLMRERDLPDRAIAAALGFCDEFHFSKTFKSVAGRSPRAWRAQR